MRKRRTLAGMEVLTILVVLISLVGCQARKKLVVATPVLTEEDKLLRAVYDQTRQAQYLDIRYTGKVQMDEQKVQVIGNVKMVRDSAIWISIRSSIGIELGRVLALPDSVWVISKIMKIKEKGDWKLIREFTDYALDFKALQGILTQSLFTAAGNRYTDIQSGLTVNRQNDETWIRWKSVTEETRDQYPYLAQFKVNPETRQVTECRVKDSKGQWAARVNYHYSRENALKKIEIGSLDEAHEYNAELNIVSAEIRDKLYISFEKF